jgi:hypothetical protein
MSASVTFDAAALAKLPIALRTIRRAVWADSNTILYGFAGVVLKTCAGRTKVATVANINRRSIVRAYRTARRVVGFGNDRNKGAVDPGQAGINLGFKSADGRVWYRTRKNHKFQPVYHAGFRKGWHIAPADFGKVQLLVQIYRTEMRAMKEAGRKAAGLARQSWVQIADSLGIRLETVKGGGALSSAGIAKARAAIASTGVAHVNGLSREERTQRSLILTLINRYPRAQRMGMDATLAGALVGQVRYFEQNLKRGVFDSIAKTTRAYPFLKVTNN